MTYTFEAEVWLYEGKDAWHFVTLPAEVSDEIEESYGSLARGFGSLRVAVSIGDTSWKTSIFPSTSAAAYVLPLKAQVRKRTGLSVGDRATFSLEVIAS